MRYNCTTYVTVPVTIEIEATDIDQLQEQLSTYEISVDEVTESADSDMDVDNQWTITDESGSELEITA